MPAVKREFDYLKGGSSASFLFNNLRICPVKLNELLYLSWIHNSVKSKSEVNMITFQNSELKNPPDYKTYRLFYPEGDIVTMAKWLWLDSQKHIKLKKSKNKATGDVSGQNESELQKNLIFCLCSTTGLVKLYSANGELLIMSKMITPMTATKVVSLEKSDNHRDSNMCVTSNGTDTIFFASKRGGLLCVKPFGGRSKKQGEYSKKFVKMSHPMCQLEFNRAANTLITGNLAGDIQVLDPNGLTILHRLNSSEGNIRDLSISASGLGCLHGTKQNKNQLMQNSVSTITCMCSGDTYLLVGYMCGRIRLFDVAMKTLLVEICSHTRSVSALDLDERTGHFVSASEDTFINVFKYNNYSSGGLEVTVAMSKKVANAVLVGVQLVHSTLLGSGNEDSNTLKGVFFTHYDSFKVGMIPIPTSD